MMNEEKSYNMLLETGMDIQEGQWEYYADGVLHFSGGTVLSAGSFRKYRKTTRRIVIDDFSIIQERLFEGFAVCEEVVFNAETVTVFPYAFAHCIKLGRVDNQWEFDDVFSGDIIEEDNAFYDTPYASKYDLVPFLPECDQGTFISQGTYGKQFLRAIIDDIDRMETMSEDRYYWFDDCREILRKGCRAGEPALQYLSAERSRHLINSPEKYIYASECGSVHARLWCAYCMDYGIEGFEHDSIGAEDFLSGIADYPKTLVFPELEFLYYRFCHLIDLARNADLIEDEIAYRHSNDPDLFKKLPDPNWKTLNKRSVKLAYLIYDFGLPYLKDLDPYSYWPRWPVGFPERVETLYLMKRKWRDWCQEKGLNVELFGRALPLGDSYDGRKQNL